MTATTETAFVGGELYRRGGQWKFRAVGQGLRFRTGRTGNGFRHQHRRRTGPAAAPIPPRQGVPGYISWLWPFHPHRPPRTRHRRRSTSPKARNGCPSTCVSGPACKEQIAVSTQSRRHRNRSWPGDPGPDASGSMAGLVLRWHRRHLRRTRRRGVRCPDDDATMQAWTFATNPARLPDVQLGDLPQWIPLHVRLGTMFGGFRKKRQKEMAAGQIDMSKVGFGNEEQKVIGEIRDYVACNLIPHPTLRPVLLRRRCVPQRRDRTTVARCRRTTCLRQFIGLGNANYGAATVRRNGWPPRRQRRILRRRRYRPHQRSGNCTTGCCKSSRPGSRPPAPPASWC